MSLVHISTPKPKDVTQKVVDALALAIHEHRLAPATKLGEDEIGEIYNVSRTVVRAALQSLAHIQLVEIQRNKGAFVASPTPREAREVFEARALLEPRTARSAASRATPSDIEILKNLDSTKPLSNDTTRKPVLPRIHSSDIVTDPTAAKGMYNVNSVPSPLCPSLVYYYMIYVIDSMVKSS